MGLDSQELPMDTCYISPRNVRLDLGDLTKLTDSVNDNPK
jgi:hypothetical protein